MHTFLRRGVFARRHFHGFRGAFQVQVIGFNSARARIAAGIRVNGNEQIGFSLIGDIGALFQRHERVIRARVNDVRSRQALLDNLSQPQRHVQAQIFLHQAGRPDGSRVVPAMSGINHDASNFQAQCAR